MKVLRVTTERNNGISVVSSSVELEFEEVASPEVGETYGVASIQLHQGHNPSLRWQLFRIPRNTRLPMHETATIDYMSVVEGHVDLVLPDAEPIRLKVGDSVVQRGALHSWQTTSSPVVMSGFITPMLLDDQD